MNQFKKLIVVCAVLSAMPAVAVQPTINGRIVEGPFVIAQYSSIKECDHFNLTIEGSDYYALVSYIRQNPCTGDSYSIRATNDGFYGTGGTVSMLVGPGDVKAGPAGRGAHLSAYLPARSCAWNMYTDYHGDTVPCYRAGFQQVDVTWEAFKAPTIERTSRENDDNTTAIYTSYISQANVSGQVTGINGGPLTFSLDEPFLGELGGAFISNTYVKIIQTK